MAKDHFPSLAPGYRPPRHGTRARYNGRSAAFAPCRCDLCRAANARYKRVWARGQRAEGTPVRDKHGAVVAVQPRLFRT